jgi:hypothetical protein
MLDDTHVLTRYQNMLVIYDLKQKQVKEIPLDYVTDIFLASPGGIVLTGLQFTDRIDIWKTADLLTAPAPRPRATLYPFSNGQWLITTPDGYFDCSPQVPAVIRWIRQGQNYPYEQFEPQYHKPELVRQALGG